MAGKFKLMFADFLRSIHQLWLEVSGALFIGFALVFGLHAVREYRKYQEAADGVPWQFAFAAGLSLLTLAFGIHSFWKSRKLR